MTLTFAVVCFQCRFIHVLNFILGMREGQTNVVLKVLADTVVMFQLDFKTTVDGFT